MSATSPSPAMTTNPTGIAARIYSVLGALLVVLVVLQIFVAGTGLFTIAHQLDNNQNYTVSQWNNAVPWGIHFFNALAIALVMLIMLAVAFAGRLSTQVKRFSGILIGLLVLQGILGFIPWPAPIAALHVLNAMAILAVAGAVTRSSWAFGRRT